MSSDNEDGALLTKTFKSASEAVKEALIANVLYMAIS